MGLIVKLLVGVLLFAGSLVGGLAATGRLNHEGTANIPLLNSFFPAPPEPVEGEEGAEGHGDTATDAHAAPGGETADATHHGDAGATDASHATDEGEQGQEPERPRRSKTGKSVVEPEKPADGGGHGGGHGGEAPAEGGHGEPAGHGDAAGEHGGGHGAKPASGHGGGHESKPKNDPQGPNDDFDALATALRSQGKTSYAPGAYFTFEGMPAGLTAEELNNAWQRVQGVVQEFDRRRTALDLREQELQELADDISRRWKELGEERLQIEQMHRELDAKIQKFQETVKLVRNDEVALLKRNAETLAAFERSKAAQMLEQQWATEKGQDEVLKLLEFMDKDTANEILALLPNAMVQDLLKKRLRVSKEPAPTGRRG